MTRPPSVVACCIDVTRCPTEGRPEMQRHHPELPGGREEQGRERGSVQIDRMKESENSLMIWGRRGMKYSPTFWRPLSSGARADYVG